MYLSMYLSVKGDEGNLGLYRAVLPGQRAGDHHGLHCSAEEQRRGHDLVAGAAARPTGRPRWPEEETREETVSSLAPHVSDAVQEAACRGHQDRSGRSATQRLRA